MKCHYLNPFSIDLFLSSGLARRAVDRLTSTERLVALREDVGRAFSGKKLIVFAKGPKDETRVSFSPDVVISVNGADTMEDKGSVSVLFLTSRALKPFDVKSRKTREALRNTDFDLLIFVGSKTAAKLSGLMLRWLRVGVNRRLQMSRLERAAVIRMVCGKDFGLGPAEARISSGIFCFLLGSWVDAKKVYLTGMSFTDVHSATDRIVLPLILRGAARSI